MEDEVVKRILNEIRNLERSEKLFVPYDIVECSDSGEDYANAKTIYKYMNCQIRALLYCNIDQLKDDKLYKLICDAYFKKQPLHWMKCEMPLFSVLLTMYICDQMRHAFDKAHEPIIADEYAKLHDKLDAESKSLLDRCYRKSEEQTRSILDEINYLNHIYKLASHINSSGKSSVSSYELMNANVENNESPIMTQVKRKGNLELMEVASAARAKSFIAHQVCQRAIESRWQPGFKIGQFYFVLYFWSFGFAHVLIPSGKSPLRRRLYCELGCSKPNHTHKRTSRDTLEGQRVQPLPDQNAVEMHLLGGSTIRKSEDGYGKRMLKKIDLFKNFYSSPNSKYFIHMMLRFVYIVFYAIVLLRLKSSNIPKLEELYYEFGLVIWQFSYVIDMGFQMFDMEWQRYIHKNRVDFCRNLIIIFNGLFMICALAIPQSRIFTLPIAHFAFYLSFIFAVIRSLKLFSTDSFFGSIVYMIKKMTPIMLKFLTVFLVFGFAYTVCYVSLKGTYADANSNTTIGWLLFSAGAFEIFGEATEGDRAGEINKCPTIFNWDDLTELSAHCLFRTWILPVLLFSYMLLSGIMLVNLVTAILNKEYDIISQQSHIYWKYKLYDRLREYETKIWIPAPLSSVYYLFIRLPCEGLLRLIRKCCDESSKNALSQLLITVMYCCGDVDTSWTPETSRRSLTQEELNKLRKFVKEEVNEELLLVKENHMLRRSISAESERLRSYSARYN